MNHVTIGDGCSIQGSVVCSNVQLQERVVLKDCQVTSSLSLSHSPRYAFACIVYMEVRSRLEPALWSQPAASAKGRHWPRKKNEYNGET